MRRFQEASKFLEVVTQTERFTLHLEKMDHATVGIDVTVELPDLTRTRENE
jgi:hypothetical protein